MISFHAEKSAVATMLSITMEKSQLNKYGCIVTEPATSRVTHFVEKPQTFISDLISCGIYLFNAGEVITLIGDSIENLRKNAIEEGIDADPRVFIESDVLAGLASGDEESRLYTMTLDTV
jgi:mannose-1-phosphate guanylyltransferase